MPFWKKRLAGILAKENGCDCLINVKRGERAILLVGRTSDVELVRELFACACLTLTALSKAVPSKVRDSWFTGATCGVQEQFKLARETPVDVQMSTALVLVDQRLKEASAVSERLGAKHTKVTRRYASENAFAAGFRTGKGLNLSQQKALA
jgi:hypothetical protein